MRVEALYRDGHKEQLVCSEQATLEEVVNQAYDVYGKAWLKHLKVTNKAPTHGKPSVHHR